MKKRLEDEDIEYFKRSLFGALKVPPDYMEKQEDEEDAKLLKEALEASNGERIPWEEVKEELGLNEPPTARELLDKAKEAGHTLFHAMDEEDNPL
jgi:hypothetical protein